MSNNFSVSIENYYGLDLIVKGVYYPAIPDSNMNGAMEDAVQGSGSDLYVNEVRAVSHMKCSVNLTDFIFDAIKHSQWEDFCNLVEKKILDGDKITY